MPITCSLDSFMAEMKKLEAKPLDVTIGDPNPAGGRIMFLNYWGECMALVWCAGRAMAEYLRESGAPMPEDGSNAGEPFWFEKVGLEVVGTTLSKWDDGLWVGRLAFEDAGAESPEMPHIRDVLPVVLDVRHATPDEWKAHLAGEWPWPECEKAR